MKDLHHPAIRFLKRTLPDSAPYQNITASRLEMSLLHLGVVSTLGFIGYDMPAAPEATSTFVRAKSP